MYNKYTNRERKNVLIVIVRELGPGWLNNANGYGNQAVSIRDR